MMLRPNPVLPKPGIMVNFREIIPFYGRKIQISVKYYNLPILLKMVMTGGWFLIVLPTSIH